MSTRRLYASLAAASSVLAQPQLRRAELAFAVAFTGDWAVTVALAVIAFEDGGAAGVGAIALVRMVPSAVGAPFVAGLVDRFRRERALAAVSALRAATLGASAILLAADVHHGYVYALVVVATAAFTVFRPTHASLLPLLCTTTAELTGANVVRGLLESIATLIGPILAGLLLASRGPADVFGVAALLSVSAVALLARMSYDPPERTATVGRGRLVEATWDGVRAVSDDRDLRLIFGLGFAQTYTRGALNVFIVVMAFDLLTMGDPGVAALSAAVGAGGLVGSFASSLLLGSHHLGRWMVISLVFWGAPIAVIGVIHPVPVAFGLIAIVGVANSLIDIPLFTLPVRLVRDEVLNRVFGVFESITTIGVALGSALTPVVIKAVGLEQAMVATGLILPLIAVFAWRPSTTIDERLSDRDTLIEVLRAAPMLRLLPVPSIEYLASRADRRTVPASTTLCEQGDPGDSFFVIAEGTADVIGDGLPIRVLHPGDSFGEIALLHEVARTATVRAAEDLAVLEIGRDAFLDVVAGHRTTHAAAEDVVAKHLAAFRPARIGV